MGTPIPVSVNISSRSLCSTAIVDAVSLLEQHVCPPRLLELELTETAIMEDPGNAKVMLHRLHDLGVKLSLDDFGAGATSLSHLSELPLDAIKLDQSLLRYGGDGRRHLVVTSMIELGHRLGLKVIAEGVETKDTWAFLQSTGCDAAQGYFIARPIPPRPASRLATQTRHSPADGSFRSCLSLLRQRFTRRAPTQLSPGMTQQSPG